MFLRSARGDTSLHWPFPLYAHRIVLQVHTKPILRMLLHRSFQFVLIIQHTWKASLSNPFYVIVFIFASFFIFFGLPFYLHHISFNCIFLSISGAATYQWIFQQLRRKMKVVGPFTSNKTNIIQKRTKNIRFFITFILYHRAVVKQVHIVWHICWVLQTPFCDATVAQCTVVKQYLKPLVSFSLLILDTPLLLKSSACIPSSW